SEASMKGSRLVLTLVLAAAPAFAQPKAAAKKAPPAAKAQPATPAVPAPAAPAAPKTGDTAPADPNKPDVQKAADANAKGQEPKDVAPENAKPKTRYFEGMGKTPEEEKLYEEISAAIDDYETESKDFKKEVQLLVEKKYEEKRNTL